MMKRECEYERKRSQEMIRWSRHRTKGTGDPLLWPQVLLLMLSLHASADGMEWWMVAAAKGAQAAASFIRTAFLSHRRSHLSHANHHPVYFSPFLVCVCVLITMIIMNCDEELFCFSLFNPRKNLEEFR